MKSRALSLAVSQRTWGPACLDTILPWPAEFRTPSGSGLRLLVAANCKLPRSFVLTLELHLDLSPCPSPTRMCPFDYWQVIAPLNCSPFILEVELRGNTVNCCWPVRDCYPPLPSPHSISNAKQWIFGEDRSIASLLIVHLLCALPSTRAESGHTT